MIPVGAWLRNEAAYIGIAPDPDAFENGMPALCGLVLWYPETEPADPKALAPEDGPFVAVITHWPHKEGDLERWLEAPPAPRREYAWALLLQALDVLTGLRWSHGEGNGHTPECFNPPWLPVEQCRCDGGDQARIAWEPWRRG